MATVTRETERYKWVTLFETKTMRIQYIRDKIIGGNEYDRIKIVKMGNEYAEPEYIVTYRYEDEAYIEAMLKAFNYQD